LKWLLGVIEQVKLKDDKKGFFQFLRSNYNTLEVSCLTNKGDRFLEIADYHGGAQRGTLRIPEGPRGSSWIKLAMEIGSFFLGQNEKKPALTPAKLIPAGGVPSRNVKGKSVILGSSRDPRVTDSMVAPISHTVNGGVQIPNPKIRVCMDPAAPRPTRRFDFVWKPKTQTIWITKNIGEARKAQWLPLRYKVVGLAQTNLLKDPTKIVTQAHSPLEPGSDQPTRQTTEENISTTEVEASVDFGADPAVELQMVAHGGCDPPIVPPVGLGDTASPSSDVAWYEVGETSGVDHDGESEDSESVRVDLADSTSDLGLVMVMPTSVDEFSEVVTLMLEDSGTVGEENPLQVVNFCSVEDRDVSSPLSCAPLARIDPVECPINVTVDCEMNPDQYSQWVKKHYSGFCKLVGFPMDTHEQECLALLQCIEVDRFKFKSSTKVKQAVGSVRKGARELRNLVSTINYDGRPNGC
jgi:hypothetical protein